MNGIVTRSFAFVRRIYHGYTTNRGGLMAAAISYWALISVIPLLLLCISLFGIALQSSDQAFSQTVKIIGLSLPGSTSIVEDRLREIRSSASATGITGLIALLWTGSQLFHVLEDALNRTWAVTRNRPFWKGRIIALGIMVIGGALLLANLGLSITTQWVQSRTLPWSRMTLAHLPFVWGSLAYFVPLVFSVVVFILIYRIIPNTRITWREAIVGGVFAGICWELAKLGFGYYVSTFGERNYSRLYGSVGGLVILVLWVNYTANILVIGGEVAKTWCEWNTPSPTRRRTRQPLTPEKPRARQNGDTPASKGRRRRKIASTKTGEKPRDRFPFTTFFRH